MKSETIQPLPSRIRKPVRPTERGFALVSAVLFLFITLVLGSSMIFQVIQELKTADRAKKETDAFNLAEAGIDYGAWKLYLSNSTSLPTTWTRSDFNGTGSFSVTADRYNGSNTCLVLTSTGTCRGWSSQVKVIGNFLTNGPETNNAVFDNALFSNSNLTLKGTADIKGSVCSNGNLTLQGTPIVEGSARAAGNILVKGGSISGTQTSKAPKMAMPTIDLAYYQSIATTAVAGGYNFSGNTPLDGVTYVDGDCTINGTFSGTGIIVAKGQVHVNGDAKLSNPATDSFAIVSAGGVQTNGNCRIEGFIYTHNLDVAADFTGTGTADILGGVVADLIISNGTLLVEYKKPTVELPGATAAPAQFAQASWRRLK